MVSSVALAPGLNASLLNDNLVTTPQGTRNAAIVEVALDISAQGDAGIAEPSCYAATQSQVWLTSGYRSDCLPAACAAIMSQSTLSCVPFIRVPLTWHDDPRFTAEMRAAMLSHKSHNS